MDGSDPLELDRRTYLTASLGLATGAVGTPGAAADRRTSSPGDGTSPVVEWERTVETPGSASFGYLDDVFVTDDGGLLAVGTAGSEGSDGVDAWVVSAGADGTVDASRRYGGSGAELLWDGTVDADGYYRLVGQTESFGSSGVDGWMLTLDPSLDRADGDSYTYGDGGHAEFHGVARLADDSLVVSGSDRPAGADEFDGLVVADAGAADGADRSVGTVSRPGDSPLEDVVAGDDRDWVATGTASGENADGFVVAGRGSSSDASVTLGGDGRQSLEPIHPAGDGRYVVGGDTTSAGPGGRTGYLASVDPTNGSVDWERALGSGGDDTFYAVTTGAAGATDPRYLAVGEVNSYLDGESSGVTGAAWLVSVSGAGEVLWEGRVGENPAVAFDVVDVGTGYVLVGAERVDDGIRGWMAKVTTTTRTTPDGTADVGFSRTFAASKGRGGYFNAVARREGEAVAVGTTDTADRTADFAWAASVDDDGGRRWATEFGTSPRKDRLFDVLDRDDGGYLALGQTRPSGAVDGWTVPVGSDGELGDRSRFGEASGSTFQGLAKDGAGGYVAGGGYNGDGTEFWDARLAFLAGDGSVSSYRGWDVQNTDWITDVARTPDGGTVAVGAVGGAGSQNRGFVADGYVVETDASGDRNWSRRLGDRGYDLFEAVVTTADGGYVAAGQTGSMGVGEHSGWLVKVDGSGEVQWDLVLGGLGADSLHGVAELPSGGVLAVGQYGAEEPNERPGAGVRPPRRPATGDAWVVAVDDGGDDVTDLTVETAGDRRLFDVVGAGDDRFLAVGQDSREGDDRGWVVEFGARIGPDAAFEVSPSSPTYGEAVTLDAGPSSGDDADLVAYEWDVDGDGTYELSGERVTHTFAGVGPQSVTLRVTDADGVTATATREIPVRYPAVYRSKLSLAGRVDEHSSLAYVDGLLEEDVEGDRAMTEETVRELLDAVDAGRIDPDTAEAAIRRLTAIEETSLLMAYRFGPSAPPDADRDVEFVESWVRIAIDTMVKLTFMAAALGALAVSGPALEFAVSAVGEVVHYVLGELFNGDDGDDATTRREAERRVNEAGREVVSQVRSGDLSNAGEVYAAIDDAVDAIVDDVTNAVRADLELGERMVDLVIGSLDESKVPTGIEELLGENFDTVYRALVGVDRAMAPDRIEGGLAGSTATVESSFAAQREVFDERIRDATATVESTSELFGEINLVESALEWIEGEDPPAHRVSTTVLSVVDFVQTQGLIGLLVGASGSTVGSSFALYVAALNQELRDAAVEGREVNEPDV